MVCQSNTWGSTFPKSLCFILWLCTFTWTACSWWSFQSSFINFDLFRNSITYHVPQKMKPGQCWWFDRVVIGCHHCLTSGSRCTLQMMNHFRFYEWNTHLLNIQPSAINIISEWIHKVHLGRTMIHNSISNSPRKLSPVWNVFYCFVWITCTTSYHKFTN